MSMVQYESEHYIFHYGANTKAEHDTKTTSS